jgi:D-3-phosphoglycerate dehydrogenase
MGDAGINIEEMANKSRGDYAYSLVDIATPASEEVIGKLNSIGGVIKVRVVK